MHSASIIKYLQVGKLSAATTTRHSYPDLHLFNVDGTAKTIADSMMANELKAWVSYVGERPKKSKLENAKILYKKLKEKGVKKQFVALGCHHFKGEERKRDKSIGHFENVEVESDEDAIT